MPFNPDFQYIEKWDNNRAVVLVGGKKFTIYHALNGGVFGKCMIYRCCDNAKDIVEPSVRLPVLIRRLAKKASQQEGLQ